MREHFAVLVPTLWVGMLIGISFIATPVKFRAKTLTQPVALEIGCVTFHVFSRIEWLLAASLLGIAALEGAAWRWLPVALVAAIVILQSIWLLPTLDRRVAGIVTGETLALSPAHRAYGALEGLKLLALLALTVAGFAR